ncbi:MAG: peptidoglycan DD-metalloendopeptidase family protein [bacterium]|nr:peptidoglycan DD-metalloendopeptidase family protein [bacterium]
MKKIIISILLIGILCLPTAYPKAETLKEYKDKLNQYIAEQKANNNKINQTENAINSSKKEVENIKVEIQKMTTEIEQMRKDIIDYNNEIKEKEIEVKEVFLYYQLSQNENLYLEYALGAENITELIYRSAIIEQIASYNNKVIDDLNNKIIQNQNKEVELKEKEEVMTKRQESLTANITELTGVKASLNENSVSVAKQIEIYKEIVESYEKLGCKDNDVIGKDCAVTSSVAGWYRPIDSGYVTSEFGYRWGSLHRAVDVSNRNPYNTKIYPVANGTIVAKYNDYYGALTIVMEHKTSNGKYYSSLYTHLSKFAPNIYVGKTVKTTDYLGYMGATGFAYGPHLHLEIAPCRLYNQSDKNCSTWNKYVSYVTNLYNNGSFKGPRELIYFPNSKTFFSGRR